MDCPACKNAMITLELAEVEIDYCAACGGIWLDLGELELLLNDSNKAKELLHSFKQATTIKFKRKCPICLKRMEEITVGTSKPDLIIDKCAKDHGLWFDKGELQDILERAELDKEHKIQKLLADIFGIKSE